MEYEFQKKGIQYEREKFYQVKYKDVILHADFTIDNKIVLEAKAISYLTDNHITQTLNYLAISKLKLGLLINFGEGSLNYKRILLERERELRRLSGSF
ncbi:MAG: NADH:ubiquinone oxidoreductase [Bacteroidetes bacterium]|nr:NADH:ubiquinone oxidoreductase [Bacteroidota bacterium]